MTIRITPFIFHCPHHRAVIAGQPLQQCPVCKTQLQRGNWHTAQASINAAAQKIARPALPPRYLKNMARRLRDKGRKKKA